MTDTDQATRQARWRSYFEQTLTGPDSEVVAATEAAMQAVARGQGQAAIIAAGRAAAAAEREHRRHPVSNGSAPGSSRKTGRTAPAAAPASPAPAAAAASSRASTTVWPANSGVVYALQQRTESLDGQFFQVWSFRLLRLEGGTRPVQPPIPVEIRGRAIVGQIAKGDVVEIPTGRAGHVRIVKSMRNYTTQTVIQARGRPFRRTRTIARTIKLTSGVIAAVVATVLLIVILVFVVGGISNFGS